jgi:hypothetical protein
MKTSLYIILLITVFLFNSFTVIAQTAPPTWLVGGNTLATDSRFGSNNAFDVLFETNDSIRGRLTRTGLWGIGNNIIPSARLHVNSLLGQTPLRVQVAGSTKFLVHDQGGVSVGSLSTPPANGLFVSGNTGIGTSLPESKLHVMKGSAGVVTGNVNSPLIVENSTHCYVNVLAPNSSESGILFGNPINNVSGGIIYSSGSLPNGLQFRTNGNVTRMTLSSTGNLDVCGRVRAKEILVQIGWCDYVFGKNYRLLSLEEVEEFIGENKHLPNIPKATEVEANGLKVADMSAKMMEKIEELTLYIIDINKRVKSLENENKTLKRQIVNQIK